MFTTFHIGAQAATYEACLPRQRQWQSDYLTPTLFWIRNPYNYIENNLAVGAELSGVAYWFVSNRMTGPSRTMNWNNTHVYAYSQQPQVLQRSTQGLDDTVSVAQFSPPTLVFDGNTGSACSSLIMTVWDYGSNALTEGYPQAYDEQNRSVASPTDMRRTPWADAYFNVKWDYGAVDGFPILSNETGLDTKPFGCPDRSKNTTFCTDCGAVPRNCHGANEACSVSLYGGCGDVLTISRFTGSFGYTDVNFSTLWLRTQFFLVTDLWLTDILGGGVNFVNSGDSSGVITGFWGLVYRSVFIGNSQLPAVGSNYADSRGPITPELFEQTGARCEKLNQVDPFGGLATNLPPALCVVPSDGESIAVCVRVFLF